MLPWKEKARRKGQRPGKVSLLLKIQQVEGGSRLKELFF